MDHLDRVERPEECRGTVTRGGGRGCVIGDANVIYEKQIPNSPREFLHDPRLTLTLTQVPGTGF